MDADSDTSVSNGSCRAGLTWEMDRCRADADIPLAGGGCISSTLLPGGQDGWDEAVSTIRSYAWVCGV